MFQEYLCQKSNEDDAKLSYEVAHRLILKLAEYVTEKAANPVKVSRNIMINHETHLNGSKHLKKMKQLGQEDVSTGTNSTSKKVFFQLSLLLFLFFQLSLRHDRFVFRVNWKKRNNNKTLEKVVSLETDDAKLSYEVAHRLILWYEQADREYF